MAGRFGREGVITIWGGDKSKRKKGVEFPVDDEASSAKGDTQRQSGLAPEPKAGCLACRRDDDHANVILCDKCNGEYHIYCLKPPLVSIPSGDWFCDKCTIAFDENDGDGLDRLVDALPPEFTSRFGEIVWAAGGVGFGWWPACIYDPRLTVGSARELAKKNLGKKHLVYFFECHEAPFSVMLNSRLTRWEEGVAEDYHLGKSARAAGKNRSLKFDHALQAAIVENGKPVEMRLEWNHPELPQSMPSPQKRKKRTSSHSNLEPDKQTRKTEEESEGEKKASSVKRAKAALNSEFARATPNRSNLKSALASLAAAAPANHIESSSEDGELYIKVLKRHTQEHSESVESVGFVKLRSRLSATFAEARAAIDDEIESECLPPGSNWKFYVPNLGPVSTRQETKVGPILEFLSQTTSDSRLGDGSIRDPLKVFVADVSKNRDSMDSTTSSASR